MARKPASIVPLIDISGSMSTDNFIGSAKVACDSFIHFFQTGDLFAILSFESIVRNVYPSNGQLVAFTNQQILTDASNAIAALQPLGSTNMGQAILNGNALLRPRPAPTGLVLLSDGQPNVGPNALDSADAAIRCYTVGLGPGTDTAVMSAIATKTSATFLYTPTPKGLNSIYFDIIGKADVAQLVSNTVRQQSEFRINVPLQANLPDATIGVAWPDINIGYGNGTNDISVTILDPESEPYSGPTVYLKRGYVMFPINAPMPGDWVVKVKYHGTTPPAITAAAVDPTQFGKLVLRAPQSVKAGQPIIINAEMQADGTPVRSLSASATAEVPRLTLGEAIDAVRGELNSVDVTPEENGGRDPELERFLRLHGDRYATDDIFPHDTVEASVRAADKGQQELQIPTGKAGLYTVNVVSIGEHPDGGRFQRTQLVTVEVV
jgi:hypothetical protein